MAELPIQHQPTVEKIYQHYVDSNADFRRPHLGASVIGEECLRKLWYSFRWCSDPGFSGRMLRLFQTGFKEEARVIKDLRDVGITVWDRDPNSGNQIHYTDPGCPHHSGSLDAIALGFEEASTNPHVVEIKSSSSNQFSKLKHSGVRKAKPLHFAQMQSYMRWSELDRAFYFVVNKDTDEIYSERVYYEQQFAENLAKKAARVIYSVQPLEKVSNNSGNFLCKYCDHSEICHNNRIPLISCRTCAYSNPEENGKWTCGKYEKVIETFNQMRPCDEHIFIPYLVPLEQIDADADAGTITYERGVMNGPGATPSNELQKVIDSLPKQRKTYKIRGVGEKSNNPPDDVLDKGYPTEFEGF